ncbi:ATP-binding protein [Alicyclobacillus acidoterrestris]|uniref:ATP-binding protein n=1 Tax=Alicyclobacillus acidoterrestris TaxID=1450 RepID=UPI003F534E0F
MDYVRNELVRIPLRDRRNLGVATPGIGRHTLRALLNRLPAGVVIFNSDECLFCNEEATDIFGRLGFVPAPSTTLADILQDLFDVQEDIDASHLYFKRVVGPASTHVDVEFSVIDAGDEDLAFLILHDVSELLEHRETVVQLEGLQVVGELAAGIAHEIRNPLASIRGFTQMIRDARDVSSVQIHTGVMLEELDRMNGLVEELLQLARPRSQQFEEADLVGILDSVVFLLNSQAILNNCSVVFSHRNEMPRVPIMCQSNKLKQAFINVIKNAVEASPNGGVVRVIMECVDDWAVVSIEDEGPGIPEEYRTLTGRKFFTTKEHGTGLGLMISHNIVQQHRGKLTIHTDLQRGALVQISLPIYGSFA